MIFGGVFVLRPFDSFGTDYLFLDDETYKMKYVTSDELRCNSALKKALDFCRYSPDEIDVQRLGMFKSDVGQVVKIENGETWVYTRDTLYRLYKMYGFGSESLLCGGRDLVSNLDLMVTYCWVFFEYGGELYACIADNYLRFGDCYVDVINRRKAREFFLTQDTSTFERIACGERISESKFKRLVIRQVYA